MLTIRDLPAVIERAIPMPPHATISQGVAVERLRAVTEAQVREVIEAERAEALREAARGMRPGVRGGTCNEACHEADKIALEVRADRIERGESS